jgi:hypothetical protein
MSWYRVACTLTSHKSSFSQITKSGFCTFHILLKPDFDRAYKARNGRQNMKTCKNPICHMLPVDV